MVSFLPHRMLDIPACPSRDCQVISVGVYATVLGRTVYPVRVHSLCIPPTRDSRRPRSDFFKRLAIVPDAPSRLYRTQPFSPDDVS
jgi:hypothetical protein